MEAAGRNPGPPLARATALPGLPPPRGLPSGRAALHPGYKIPYFNPAAILRISSADHSPANGSRGCNPVARKKAEGRNPGPPLARATTLPGFHPGYKFTYFNPAAILRISSADRSPASGSRGCNPVARMRPEGSHLGWQAEGRNPGPPLARATTLPGFHPGYKFTYFNPAAIFRISSAERSPANGSRGCNPVARMGAAGRNPGPPLVRATTLPGFHPGYKIPYFNPAAILRISSADRSPANGSRGCKCRPIANPPINTGS